jgi:hypothetical protein
VKIVESNVSLSMLYEASNPLPGHYWDSFLLEANIKRLPVRAIKSSLEVEGNQGNYLVIPPARCIASISTKRAF